MLGKTVEFEWQTGESDFSAIRPPVSTQAQREAADEQSAVFGAINRLLFRIGLLAVGALLLATSNNIPLDELKLARASAGIERAISLETEAWETRDHKLFVSTFDSSTESEWRRQLRLRWEIESSVAQVAPTIQIRDISYLDATQRDTAGQGEVIFATLTMADGDGFVDQPQRQYRFYREVEGQWVQTLPTKEFWGETEEIETPHLRFRFREREAAVVAAVADDLERTLGVFYAVVGEPMPPNEHVTLELIPRVLYGWAYAGDRLMVSSPLMLSIPVGSSDADAFASTIATRFGYRVLDLVRQKGREPLWRTLWSSTHSGIHSWLMVSVAQQPPQWNAKANAIFAQHVRETGPLRLDDLRGVTDQVRFPYEWYLQTKLAESVVAFADHTYGRDKIPAMLHGLANFRSWDDLTRGVYEVSREEFEAGWNRYVENRY